MQEGHPIAFWSKGLSGKYLTFFTYEKELMAVVLAVLKWRHYLLGRHFIIKTDHQSLKYLLEQRVATPFQQKWIAKLLGYDHEITYKHGTENKVADALSRREDLFPATANTLLVVDSSWLPTIKLSWQTDLALQQLITELVQDPNSHHGFSWANGILTYKGSLVVGNSQDLRKQLMAAYHNSSMGGHSGIDKTTRRIKRTFYWKGLKKDVQLFISKCLVCQRFKGENVHPSRLLQPFPVPENVWSDISMDFIEGLPKSHGQTTIFVVVDRLTKYAHFMSLSHPYTAKDVAQLFLDNVYKLHGLPSTIVSDRDVVFTSLF